MNKEFDPANTIKKLKTHGALQYTCPVCKGNSFAVQGEVATITTTKDINTMNLGSYVPCAMMICTACGNVQLFALGILDKEG